MLHSPTNSVKAIEEKWSNDIYQVNLKVEFNYSLFYNTHYDNLRRPSINVYALLPHRGEGAMPKFLGWPDLWAIAHVLQTICDLLWLGTSRYHFVMCANSSKD